MTPSLPQATPHVVSEVELLCDRGLCLQALRHLDSLRDIDLPAASLAEARVLRRVGAERQGDALMLRTWRWHPDDSRARLAMFRHHVYRRGPYSAFCWRERLKPQDRDPKAIHAEFAGAEAFLYSLVRDFEASRRSFENGCEQDPTVPWLWQEWSYALERMDRYSDAMETIEHILSIDPAFQSGIQFKAHLLTLASMPEAAMDLLHQAFTRTESADIGIDLLNLLMERSRHEEALSVLERIRLLQPLADGRTRQWWSARRSDIALRVGDYERAAVEAEGATGPFYEPLAQRIRKAGHAPAQMRIELPVGFVRQHWMTCGPATLATLCRYWGRSFAHIDIAESICYDGTSYHSERKWAESQGFLVREFTLSWAVARSLLDKGIPFTLSTVATGNGHLQAVIGYDLLRNSLLIRDPYIPSTLEFEVDSLLDGHRSSGPRCMVMLPPERAESLAPMTLPESEFWDGLYEVSTHLANHDRDAAEKVSLAMAARDPEHLLVIACSRQLAGYDADPQRSLSLVEQLLSKYPEDTNLQLSKASHLMSVGGKGAHLAWLEQLATRTGADPQVLGCYADRLSEDGRRLAEAMEIARTALRRAPLDPPLWFQMANLSWLSGERTRSRELYRFAACLQETNEDYARSYFRACHLLNESASGLGFLKGRVERLGHKSCAPAFTLFEQLEGLGRTDEGFEVLRQAMKARPDDSELIVFHAEARLRNGQSGLAKELLESVQGGIRRANHLRVHALLAESQGDLVSALEHAQAASTLEPVNIALHGQIASLHSRIGGHDAAIAWLRRACAAYPHHLELARLLYEWLSEASPRDREQVLLDMRETHPGDPWVLRELALHYTREQRFSEADPYIEEGLLRAPQETTTHGVLGFLALQRRGYKEAVPHLKEAIRLCADNGFAMSMLLEASPSLEERRQGLDFILSELKRQVTVGDGLLSFQRSAQGVLDPETLLQKLVDARNERPDLWHAWVAEAAQRCDMGQSKEALAVIEDALSRFSHLPRLFVEQARAHRLSGDRPAAKASLMQALAISPAWGVAVREYVEVIVDLNEDLVDAEHVIRKALLRGAENPDLRGLLGWLLERMGRPSEALEAVRASLKLDPGPRWVWETARRLLGAEQRLGEFESWIEDMVASRPGDPIAWAVKAELMDEPSLVVQAADKALAIAPRFHRAWAAKLQALLSSEQYGALEEALSQLPWKDDAPLDLQMYRPRSLRKKGSARGAYLAMKQVLARDPNRFLSWLEVANWYSDDDQLEDYHKAARELVRLAPNHAVAHGHLGLSLERLGRKDEALRSYRRSLELDPAYEFGAERMANVAREAKDIQGADWAVNTAYQQSPSARWALEQLLNAKLREEDEAIQETARRALTLVGKEEVAARVVDLVYESRWRPTIESILRDLVRQGHCPVPALQAWLRQRSIVKKALAVYEEMKPLIAVDASHSLKLAFLCHAEKDRSRELLDRMVKDHRQVLRSDDELWAQTGLTYQVLGDWKRTQQWMSDWRERPGAPGWALENLALSCFNHGRRAEGLAVAGAIMDRHPGVPAGPLWMAAEAVRRNADSVACEYIQMVARMKTPNYLQPLAALLHGFQQAVHEGKPRLASTGLAIARRSFTQLPALKGLWRRAMLSLSFRHSPWWQGPFQAILFLLD